MLLSIQRTAILQLLQESDCDKHYSIELDLMLLADINPAITNTILADPQKNLLVLEKALYEAQLLAKQRAPSLPPTAIPKTHILVRLCTLPPIPGVEGNYRQKVSTRA